MKVDWKVNFHALIAIQIGYFPFICCSLHFFTLPRSVLLLLGFRFRNLFGIVLCAKAGFCGICWFVESQFLHVLATTRVRMSHLRRPQPWYTSVCACTCNLFIWFKALYMTANAMHQNQAKLSFCTLDSVVSLAAAVESRQHSFLWGEMLYCQN